MAKKDVPNFPGSPTLIIKMKSVDDTMRAYHRTLEAAQLSQAIGDVMSCCTNVVKTYVKGYKPCLVNSIPAYRYAQARSACEAERVRRHLLNEFFLERMEGVKMSLSVKEVKLAILSQCVGYMHSFKKMPRHYFDFFTGLPVRVQFEASTAEAIKKLIASVVS